jgi:hypothetical protein
MKHSILFFLVSLVILSAGCKRQKVLPTRYLTFTANPSYTGSHPTANLVSNIYVQDQGDNMLFLTDMSGADATKDYKLHIHRADSTELYGYSGNPVLDLGTMANNIPVSTKVTYLSFADFFKGDFKGYYVVHDPDNINNDTTTLLVFGKIGSWE